MARGLFFATVALLSTAAFAAPPVTTQAFGVGDVINALGVGLVSKIHATITLESLETDLINVDFDVKNPLPIELTLKSISNSAGLNGTEYARFSHTFPSPGLVVPPLGTANSGTISGVRLTQGATASLDIIPFGVLDILDADAKVQAATIAGFLGFPVPIDNLKQKNVPTTYDLDLS